MRAVIIDDEEDVHKVITHILDRKCPHVKVMGNAHSVETGLKVLKETEPNLVFLDIKMPGGTGFDILEKIGHMPFKLIFITAYDEYAIRAIKMSAVDYIMKPVHSHELVNAVKKAELMNEQDTRVLSMISHLRGERQNRKLTVTSVGKVQFIDLDNISHIQSDGAYSNIFLSGQRTILSSKSIKDYEEMLPEKEFFRIHRSHIINLSHVVEYIKSDSGDKILLKNGSSVEVYRKKRIEFMEAMAAFNGT